MSRTPVWRRGVVKRWYWWQWRETDHLALFSRWWDRDGRAFSMVCLGFWLMGAAGFFMALFTLPSTKQPAIPLVGAVFCASGLGIAGVMYTAVAVCSLAYSSERRIAELELRIKVLEDRSDPTPDRQE